MFLGQDLGTYAREDSGDSRNVFKALLELTALYNKGVSWRVWKRVLYNNPVTGLI